MASPFLAKKVSCTPAQIKQLTLRNTCPELRLQGALMALAEQKVPTGNKLAGLILNQMITYERPKVKPPHRHNGISQRLYCISGKL